MNACGSPAENLVPTRTGPTNPAALRSAVAMLTTAIDRPTLRCISCVRLYRSLRETLGRLFTCALVFCALDESHSWISDSLTAGNSLEIGDEGGIRGREDFGAWRWECSGRMGAEQKSEKKMRRN